MQEVTAKDLLACAQGIINDLTVNHNNQGLVFMTTESDVPSILIRIHAMLTDLGIGVES